MHEQDEYMRDLSEKSQQDTPPFLRESSEYVALPTAPPEDEPS